MTENGEQPARRLVYVPLPPGPPGEPDANGFRAIDCGGGMLIDPDAPPREEPIITGGSVREYPWGQRTDSQRRRHRRRRR